MTEILDNGGYKEVYFEAYCKHCKHISVSRIDEPCNECLDNPTNLHSHKPVLFEEKED